MKDRSFDDIIKNKLNQIHPPLPSDAWYRFEHLLDDSESGVPTTSSTLIDEVAFNKLHDLQLHQPAPNWSQLRRRMDAQWLLSQRLAKYKVVEATLLALIVLLFVRFGDTPTEQPQPSAPQASLQPADIEITRTRNNTSLTEAVDTPSPAETNTLVPPVVTKAPIPLYENRHIQPTPSLPLARFLAISQEKSTLTLTPVSTLASLPATDTHHDSALPFIDGTAMPDHIAGPPLSFSDGLDLEPKKSTSTLTVGMFGGAVYNRVLTPPDESLGIVGFDRYTLGYGGGVSLGLEMGRFEFGSGLGYNAVRYEPIPLLVTRGYFNRGYTAEKFDFVELNVLSLPVYARFNLILDEHWRAFTTAGASLQVAYETNFYGVFPEDLSLPNGLIQARRNESTFSNRFGWFEGGSFRENSFITLNLGLGVERIFTDRFSLFVQPTYSHNLGYFSSGMGPTHDRIHSMSILSGVRVRFKQ